MFIDFRKANVKFTIFTLVVGKPVTLLEGFFVRFDEQGNLIEFSS